MAMLAVTGSVLGLAVAYVVGSVLFAACGPVAHLKTLVQPFTTTCVSLRAVLVFEFATGAPWVYAVCTLDNQTVSSVALVAMSASILWLGVAAGRWRRYGTVVAAYTGAVAVAYAAVFVVVSQVPRKPPSLAVLIGLHTFHRVVVDGLWALRLGGEAATPFI